MWEPGGSSSSSSSSSSNSNRGVVVLVTTLSVCVLLYKAWGPLLLITCALVLVVHTCYSLLVNDSLFAPHTLVLLRYAKDFGLELILTLKLLFALGFEKSSKAVEYLKRRYEEGNRKRFNELVGSPGSPDEDMNGRQRNAYRLSITSTDLSERTSPINHDPYHSFALNGACDGARTSTPIPRGITWRKGMHPNGDLSPFMPINTYSPKKPPLRSENKQPSITLPRCEETLYSPKGSPWGNSISPKMRERVTGVKTVQTVAGPLLASTRYNIDPKIYTDVSSPGLTTRLTKYATEANNKLTHQPQYGTGQFPKVNLHASPTPLLSPKIARARIPVTVRVAPPEIVNYSLSECHTHQERHKMFSNNSVSELKESTSCPSIDPVLKKISLKRHASREDMLELAKKQRAEKMYYGQLENLEEMMQKRARDESMTSEDDLSPQSKTQRPTKRPKASSCHDILHSLSSSLNVFSGVKRKAIDTSRCNTPDIEKHFKPSTKSPNKNSYFTTNLEKEITSSKEQLNVKVPIANASGEPHQHKKKEKSPEVPKIKERSQETQTYSLNDLTHPASKVLKSNLNVPKDSKLTDKLFMRPDPQTNEKLKTLIEEQGNVEAKFTTDDKDEIKKQDIINMRQNSMRLRLQSMFDAISGKSANKIDPDVVIQAEEMNPHTSSSYTSLSSMTSTTMVNSSPIATTIVPILKSDTESKSPTTKHVTFDLPVSTSSSIANSISVSSLTNEESTVKPPESKPLGKEAPNFGVFTTSAQPLAFNFVSSSAPSVVSNSPKPETTSDLIFPKLGIELNSTPVSNDANSTSNSNSNITRVTTNSNVQSKNTMSTIVSSAPVVSTTMSEAPKNSSFVMNSSGFTFGSIAKTTAPTTSIPVISFNSVASTVAKITELKNSSTCTTAVITTSSVVPNFGNALLRSPASTFIAQPTIALSTSVGDKKESVYGGFSFGATTSSSTSTNSSNMGQTTPTFSISVPSPIFSSAPMATTSVAPAFTFGATAKSATSTFSFGATTAATPSTVANTSFGVGTQAHNTGTGMSTTFPSTATSMGSPVITAASVAPAFGSSTPSLFGATNSPSLFSGSSNTTPTTIFKSPSTTTSVSTPTIFGSQSAIPSFGTSVPASLTSTSTPVLTTAASTTTVTPNLFGNAGVSKPTTTSIPSLFGNVAPVTTATTTAPRSTFGDPTAVQHQTQPSNIFSGMSGTTSGPTSIFGSSVVASSSGTSAGLFSGSNSATQNSTNLVSGSSPADNTSIFGMSKSPSSMPFGATNANFGQAKPSPTFALSNTNNASTSSAFQMGSGGPLPTFNTATGPQSSSTPSTSIFGSAFGSASPANNNSGGFGVQGNTNPGTFGGASPNFGTGSATTSSPFGGQPSTNQAPNLFGNVVTPSAASFTFGSTQPQQQPQPQQPAASFSFGGSTNPGTASTSGLFQFGSASANKPAGFNFNAPAATPSINFTGSAAPTFNAGAPPGAPPTFNAPPTNMFSIGSSSSTPRSRTSRQRRQR